MRFQAQLFTAAGVCVALALFGCPGEQQPPREPDEYVIECGAPDAGSNAAADETWVKFEEARSGGKLVVDDCRAPVLTSPASGDALDPDSPPVISFNPAAAACTASLPRCGPAGRPSVLSQALGLLISTAHAHCTGATGENYLLELRPEGADNAAYSALLSITSYTPQRDAWKAALDPLRGQKVVLKIQRAEMFRGSLKDGPYVQAAGFSFDVRR